MPGKKLTVNPRALRKSSETLNEPASTLQTALDNFYTKVNGLPAKPWGTDDMAHAFVKQYEGHEQRFGSNGKRGYEALLAGLVDLIDGLGVMRKKTRAMALHYAKAEEANQR